MSHDAIRDAFALSGLSSSEKLICVALADLAGRDRQCWPSSRQLARMSSIQPASVRKILRDLERRALISRTQRTGDKGQTIAPLVTLRFVQPERAQ